MAAEQGNNANNNDEGTDEEDPANDNRNDNRNDGNKVPDPTDRWRKLLIQKFLNQSGYDKKSDLYKLGYYLAWERCKSPQMTPQWIFIMNDNWNDLVNKFIADLKLTDVFVKIDGKSVLQELSDLYEQEKKNIHSDKIEMDDDEDDDLNKNQPQSPAQSNKNRLKSNYGSSRKRHRGYGSSKRHRGHGRSKRHHHRYKKKEEEKSEEQIAEEKAKYKLNRDQNDAFHDFIIKYDFYLIFIQFILDFYPEFAYDF